MSSATGTVEGFGSDPKGFLQTFDSVVLVANSRESAAVLAALEVGVRPLFVFFNRVYRILDAPFRRDCLLVSRSSPVGASLVYRREIADVLALLNGPGFHGIVNVRARERERFSAAAEFGGAPVGFLDLCDWALELYPLGRRMPSTGFAVAVWLAQQNLGIPIHLSGFSGVRDGGWRVFDAHDWTYEQVVLQLLYRSGRLRRFPPEEASEPWPVAALAKTFPEMTPDAVSGMASEVLSERLSATNRMIDHIYTAVRPQLALRDLVRSLRPRSRKARTRDALLKARDDGGAA